MGPHPNLEKILNFQKFETFTKDTKFFLLLAFVDTITTVALTSRTQ